MADEHAQPPALFAALTRADDDTRKKFATAVHPEYADHVEDWQVLLDAVEGEGGFRGGAYLWQFPREEQTSYTARQDAARYHNVAEAITELYARKLFGGGITRETTDPDLAAWFDDMDGRKTTLTHVMRTGATSALTAGHAGFLIDKSTVAPLGPAKADDVGRVVPLMFPATAILDWRVDGDRLVGIRLSESITPASLLTPAGEETVRLLLWADDGWVRIDESGNVLTWGAPDLGFVPFVRLRFKPNDRSPILGRSVFGHANIPRAIYNRESELDNILRDQAFSQLFVDVGVEGDVTKTRDQLGSVLGSSKAIVLNGKAQFETASMDVPTTLQGIIDRMVIAMYRAAHIRAPKDSAQVETAEAIKLLNDELDDVLQGFAAACAQAEREIVRARYGWLEPTPEAAEAAYQAAGFNPQYPTAFFLEDVSAELEEIQAALDLQLGATMSTRLKMRAVRRLEPTLDEPTAKKIEAEIDTISTAPPLDLGADPEADPEADPADNLPS